MTKLSVNVNKIAWLRNARGENRPNLLETSKVLVDCGVDGLTVHPRPDLRHITPDDVYDLSNLCKNSNIEFNIEGNPYSEKSKDYPGFIQLVNEIEPDQCTLVPDAPDQLTSDHGWQIDGKDHNVLINIIEELKTDKTRVSLFVDPDIKQIENIKSIGANRIELYTGPYALNPILEVLSSYETSYNYAKSIGLDVNAGHDLDLENLKPFLDRAPVDEVSIGHALISDALIDGLDTVTKKYLDLCK
ncbi:MAG: pyridoxine 5'-phosphate synthase [Gammaproteobacteria bacterium]|nr:MAG: pyridoxine 5'-phosphate synthase [Gammaproteobacteria bacterium]|tara:strand:- start:1666 stop:2400 length:735 start_codon:yes stop_codon:yes gene_type:complete